MWTILLCLALAFVAVDLVRFGLTHSYKWTLTFWIFAAGLWIFCRFHPDAYAKIIEKELDQ